jgi:thiol-disulfide isomerase/thioredoxin
MRRILFLTLAFLLLSVLPVLAGGSRPKVQPAGVQVGSTAPNFTLKDVQGRTVSLADFRGKVVFLNFWATWCPPCRAEMPSMERLNEVLGKEQFAIVAVNVEEDPQGVRDWLKKNPHRFTVLLDPQAKAQNLYKVFRFPETFLIGKDGKVLQHYIGARDWSSVEFLKYATSVARK